MGFQKKPLVEAQGPFRYDWARPKTMHDDPCPNRVFFFDRDLPQTPVKSRSMSQNQQISRDKPAVKTPASDGSGANGVDVGKETKGKEDVTEKARKKKKKIKGNGEDKGTKFEEDRAEDRDSGDGQLVDEVKKKKKKKKMMLKKRTKEDSKDVENAKGGKRGVSEDCEGAKVNSPDDSMNKRHRDKNGDKEGSAVVSLTRSEGQRVQEDEAKIASKKQRAEKKKDTEKEENETDKVKLKSGEESGSSTRAKQLTGDVTVRADSKCSQSNPPIVVVLCLSRRASPNKKMREKTKGNGKKLGEGRKRKSSGGDPEFDTARTSGLKKKRASREKADEKDSKSCRLPLNRVRTIVRSHNSNTKITQESYFLICKATECFIEQFCKEAFSLAASHGLKKLLKYDHLASLVYNMDRYDFLSDYVPWKMKAKDVLAETEAAEDRPA